MKKIKYIIIILIVSLLGYGVYTKLNKQTPPEPSPIDLIMQEESFQKSMRIQAEYIHLDREDAKREKRKEELRKEELNLASTTTSLKE
jgi:hypothetical protein